MSVTENGMILQYFREVHNLNRVQLARIIRVAKQSITNWESGKVRAPGWIPLMLWMVVVYCEKNKITVADIESICSLKIKPASAPVIYQGFPTEKENANFAETVFIYQFCDKYHLTKGQLAKLLRVSKSNVNHWVNGRFKGEPPKWLQLLLYLLDSTNRWDEKNIPLKYYFTETLNIYLSKIEPLANRKTSTSLSRLEQEIEDGEKQLRDSVREERINMIFKETAI